MFRTEVVGYFKRGTGNSWMYCTSPDRNTRVEDGARRGEYYEVGVSGGNQGVRGVRSKGEVLEVTRETNSMRGECRSVVNERVK